jgi:hypothetical protein
MAKAIEVTGTYQDQAGKTATNTMFIPNGLTLAQIVEGLQAAAAIIDAAITALLTGLEFTISVDISGLTNPIAADSADVEEVNEYIFATADGRDVRYNIPAGNNTASPAGTDDLDQANANVAAFISMIEDGIAVTGGTVTVSDVDEDDITNVLVARERVRNSGSS